MDVGALRFAVAKPALRHRIVRSFEAEAEGVTTDDVVARLLESLPRIDEAAAERETA